jgi:hypothetical protein
MWNRKGRWGEQEEELDHVPLILTVKMSRTLAENPMVSEMKDDEFFTLVLAWVGLFLKWDTLGDVSKGHLVGDLVSVGFIYPEIADQVITCLGECGIPQAVADRTGGRADLAWAALLRASNYSTPATEAYLLGAAKLDWAAAIECEIRAHDMLN